ncbi:MAG: hypothetical protein K6G75_02485 [Lachnospiraceae bacterium]|nr:hypothetical protein [Lachnospiraceae bacterium]
MANLLLLIKRNKLWVAAGILMTILSNLSQMTFVYLIGKLVNHIENRSSITISFILLIACLMASNAFTLLLKQYIGRLSTEKMAHSLRMGYAKRLIKSTVKEKTSASKAMSAAQNELAQANSYLSNTFFDIVGMLIMAVLVTAYLLLQNVLLTLVIIVPSILILIYVFFSSRRLSGIVSLAQNEKNKMNKTAYSMIHAFPSVKIFGGEKLCLNAYNDSFDIWKKQWVKMGRLSALYNTLSGVLSRVPLLLLLLVGGFMVIRGNILMGTLIVFVIMQGSLSESIMNLPNWIANFKVFTTNLSRIDIE